MVESYMSTTGEPKGNRDEARGFCNIGAIRVRKTRDCHPDLPIRRAPDGPDTPLRGC